MSFSHELRRSLAPYQDHLKDIGTFVFQYLKNPVEAMRVLPDWEWKVLIGLYAALAAACGLLSGLIARKFTLMIQGLFIFPIASSIGNFVLAGFFYYTFLFFFRKEISYRKLYTITIFSMLPFLVLYLFSGLLPPINLMGFAVSGALFVVGLSENTTVPRGHIAKLVGAMYALFLIFYIIQSIEIEDEKTRLKEVASPQSIEILKKEMGN